MTDDGFDYPRLLQDALLSVLRSVLEQAAETGFPGDHHAFVTFQTEHPGVELPGHLREAYPTKMVIVLQHRFWDLDVDHDGFSVTLEFNGKPTRLHVPFAAVDAFVDPSAGFGLQYRAGADDENEVADNEQTLSQPSAPEPDQVADVLAFPRPPTGTDRDSGD